MNINTQQISRTWKDTLDRLSRNLNVLTTTTEDEFLTIGAHLNDYYTRTVEISRMASSLVDSMSESEMNMVIDGFRDLLERMQFFIRDTETGFKKGSEVLQDIYSGIGTIHIPVEGFKKIVKTLRVLSISTKIESFKLHQDDNGFIVIADDVEKLAALINSKYAYITSKAEALKELAGQTLRQVNDLQIKQRGKTQSILDSTRITLLSLTQKNELSFRMARVLADDLCSISKNIEEVVASMQFHDITRQQIEHVKETMEGLRGKLDAPTEEEATIRETGAVCELQAAQLLDAREKFTRAVENIMDNLTGISVNIMKVYEDVQKISGSEDKTSSSFFSRIESGATSVLSSLKENATVIGLLSDTMENLISNVGNISVFVGDIEEINAEIELIAINAGIKAAHTGEEGAPLGVIAEAIQRLSANTLIQKTAISDRLFEITSSAGKLRLSIHSNTEEQGTETDMMVNNLNTITRQLRSGHEAIATLLRNIQEEGYGLAGDIDKILSEIKVHQRFTEEIDNVCAALNTIVARSREIIPDAHLAYGMETLNGLERRYTMESQRAIHISHISHARGKKTGRVPKVIKPHKEDLGENVELF